ncbi:Ig-like domain-containing protein [Aquicoccus sp. G2-2]|uniref:Ig-like domain-containing protein n=1 Tax=Aquicoccus sp. G2-2 TaxID=3092120 RepID=UPI002ADF6738|nr:Ig-like domain-containing protein [Aquicoccus sp. G2-2]MEA1112960.1 Ig-like domain-containing protein [Aquicoccus sp. G2-2]
MRNNKEAAEDTRAWEGVGTGWFYSSLGGGAGRQDRIGTVDRKKFDPKTYNNSAKDGKGTAIASVFNGDFQASEKPLYGRMPIPARSTFETPGWSLQGGNSYRVIGALPGSGISGTQGLFFLPENALGWEIDLSRVIKPENVTASAWKIFKDQLDGLMAKLRSSFDGVVNKPPASDKETDYVSALLNFVANAALKGIDQALTYTFDDDFFKTLGDVFDKFEEDALRADLASKGLAYLSPSETPEAPKSKFGGLADAALAKLKEKLPDILAFVQKSMINWHYKLGAGAELVHNTMYFNEKSDQIGVDVTWDDRVAGGDSKLALFAYIDGSYIELTPVNSAQVRNDTVPVKPVKRQFFEIPEEVQGKAGQLVIRNVTDAGATGSLARIDNIGFRQTLKITDSDLGAAAGASDLTILFTDTDQEITDGDGREALKVSQMEGLGIDRHQFTFENLSDRGMDVTLTLDPSEFLTLDALPDAWRLANAPSGVTGFPVSLHDGSTSIQLKTNLRAGESQSLTLTASLSNDFLEDVAGDAGAMLLGTKMLIHYVDDAPSTKPGVTRIDETRTAAILYLADMGDDAANDGILRLADTADGQTRTLRIVKRLGGLEDVDLSLAGDSGKWFTGSDSAGAYEIGFAPEGVGDKPGGADPRFPDASELVITRAGERLGSFAVEAAATKKQVVGISADKLQAEIKTQLAALRAREVADGVSEEDSFALRFNGLTDADWRKVVAGIKAHLNAVLAAGQDAVSVTTGAGDFQLVFKPGAQGGAAILVPVDNAEKARNEGAAAAQESAKAQVAKAETLQAKKQRVSEELNKVYVADAQVQTQYQDYADALKDVAQTTLPEFDALLDEGRATFTNAATVYDALDGEADAQAALMSDFAASAGQTQTLLDDFGAVSADVMAELAGLFDGVTLDTDPQKALQANIVALQGDLASALGKFGQSIRGLGLSASPALGGSGATPSGGSGLAGVLGNILESVRGPQLSFAGLGQSLTDQLGGAQVASVLGEISQTAFSSGQEGRGMLGGLLAQTEQLAGLFGDTLGDRPSTAIASLSASRAIFDNVIDGLKGTVQGSETLVGVASGNGGLLSGVLGTIGASFEATVGQIADRMDGMVGTFESNAALMGQPEAGTDGVDAIEPGQLQTVLGKLQRETTAFDDLRGAMQGILGGFHDANTQLIAGLNGDSPQTPSTPSTGGGGSFGLGGLVRDLVGSLDDAKIGASGLFGELDQQFNMAAGSSDALRGALADIGAAALTLGDDPFFAEMQASAQSGQPLAAEELIHALAAGGLSDAHTTLEAEGDTDLSAGLAKVVGGMQGLVDTAFGPEGADTSPFHVDTQRAVSSLNDLTNLIGSLVDSTQQTNMEIISGLSAAKTLDQDANTAVGAALGAVDRALDGVTALGGQEGQEAHSLDTLAGVLTGGDSGVMDAFTDVRDINRGVAELARQLEGTIGSAQTVSNEEIRALIDGAADLQTASVAAGAKTADYGWGLKGVLDLAKTEKVTLGDGTADDAGAAARAVQEPLAAALNASATVGAMLGALQAALENNSEEAAQIIADIRAETDKVEAKTSEASTKVDEMAQTAKASLDKVQDGLAERSVGTRYGFASFDFAAANSDATNEQAALDRLLDPTVDGTFTPAQQIFRQDALFNTNLKGDRVILDVGAVLESLRAQSGTEGFEAAEAFSDAMGWAYAHEVLHTLGLPDYYDRETQAAIGDPTVLSTPGNFDTTPAMDAMIRMALNAPVDADPLYIGIRDTLRQAQEAGLLSETAAEGLDYAFAPGDGVRVLSSGWSVLGNVGETADGIALGEGPATRTAAYRMIDVPGTATTFSFTMLTRMSVTPSGPGDAFEIALLNRLGRPLSVLAGLSGTDAALNLQADGTLRMGPGLSVGAPQVQSDGFVARSVTVDLTALDLTNGLQLSLDLLGFGAVDAEARIAAMAFDVPSTLTNAPPVAASQTVVLDEDGAAVIDLGLLSGDPDGDPLVLAIARGPGAGLLDHISGTLWRYTPGADFNGVDLVQLYRQ